jgi:5-methylcytosine-specific restriction endonuclease McrA
VKVWLQNNPGKNSEYVNRWRVTHPGAQRASERAWYEKNRDVVLAKDKARRAANYDAFLQKERESYARNSVSRKAKETRWRAANPHKMCAQATARRSAKMRRTPPWLTDEHRAAFDEIYCNAALLTKFHGEKYHVDHIVPLRGVTVSGLHVPWNLQILSAKENLSKSNRVWPDMP